MVFGDRGCRWLVARCRERFDLGWVFIFGFVFVLEYYIFSGISFFRECCWF